MLKICRLTILFIFVMTYSPVATSMCKWVDDNGVTHYAEHCPEEVSHTEVEIQPQPPQDQLDEAAQRLKQIQEMEKTPVQRTEAVRSLSQEESRPLPDNPTPRVQPTSWQEWDALCEQEREKHIAPLREAEIRKCIVEQRKNPDYCNRYWSDYGEGGVSGDYVRPRMFMNLPECVEAWKARTDNTRR